MSDSPGSPVFKTHALLVACLAASAVTGCGHSSLPAPGTSEYRQYASAFYVGLAALQVGDDARADASLHHATELVSKEPAGWADWGVLALRQRDLAAAAQRLEKAHALAPDDERVHWLLALLASAQGNSQVAIAELENVLAKDPKNRRVLYRLSQELEQQGAEGSGAQQQQLLTRLVAASPGNTAAQVELCRVAAKNGNAALLRATLAQLVAASAAWPQEAQQQLGELQKAVNGPQPRMAATRSVFLRNVLMRQPEFRASLDELAAQPGEEAQPLLQFVSMANEPSQPSAPDTQMTFTSTPFFAKAPWASAIALNGDSAPMLAVADAHTLRLANGVQLVFPGKGVVPGPHGVLAVDTNYDFKNDLLLAGAGGVRLYRQTTPSSFLDVTVAARLPQASYTGAWAADIEADGDLDIVLGSEHGELATLRNNGDDTFTVIHPFTGVAGLQQFAWADLDGDGNPDVALLDGSGRVHVFFNRRAGHFEQVPLPTALGEAKAITIAGSGLDGFFRLHVLRANGDLLALAWHPESAAWTSDLLAKVAVTPGPAQLLAGDFDNNGAVDLLVSQASGSALLLQDAAGIFHAMPQPAGIAQVLATADIHSDGRLDLLGLSSTGEPVDAHSSGTKNYGWQTIRPRARQSTGDQRINPFGIGGAIQVRSGLLTQQTPIDGPALHFGLGEHTGVDVARIMWPNGTVRAEFGLKANQQIVTEQRLKGSCPFLFAWNGTQMAFVKDSVPWGAAIGLQIDGLGTAHIAATEEWYKIGGNQLKPRNGFYDLRITGELWESYFYDSLALMTVDHPAGTEVYTDERFDVPPVPLALTATAEPHAVTRAVDDTGADKTATVQAVDGRYLDTFGRGQYQGITRDHYVEVELGDNVPAGTPLWLIATGWLHPSDSTVNVAMSQGAHAKPQWLSLEIPDGHGGWRVAKPNLGFPAGRNKTCLIDLTGLFPAGTPHRLRLRTNLEIYWDQLAWAQGLSAAPIRIDRLHADSADLHYRGFSQIHQANASSPELPDYNHIAFTAAQWQDLPGFYTRFGDVKELLAATDDRYVIMNAGDEMSLRFRAPAPPPPGWVRDYVIVGDGWVKDGDYNSAESASVMPYPHHARTDYSAPATALTQDWEYQHHRSDWQTYQTRYVSGGSFQKSLTLKGAQ